MECLLFPDFITANKNNPHRKWVRVIFCVSWVLLGIQVMVVVMKTTLGR